MKATRKLIPAVLMLVLSLVLTSVASYAWFTTGTDIAGTGMQISANVPLDLKISNLHDGVYGYSTVVTEKAADYLAVTQIYPSSSIDGFDFYTVQGRLGGAPKNGEPTHTSSLFGEPEKITACYIDFVVYLRSSGTEDFDLAIDTETSSISGVSFYTYEAVTVADPDTFATAKTNSRDGKLYTKTGDEYNEYTGIYDSALTYYTRAASDISKSARIAVVAAKNDADEDVMKDYDDATAGTQTLYNVFASETRVTAGAITTYPSYFANAHGPIYKTGAYTYNTMWDATDTSKTDTNLTDGEHAVFSVTSGETVTVTLRIWIEGQSQYCENSVGADTIKANIGFKSV